MTVITENRDYLHTGGYSYPGMLQIITIVRRYLALCLTWSASQSVSQCIAIFQNLDKATFRTYKKLKFHVESVYTLK